MPSRPPPGAPSGQDPLRAKGQTASPGLRETARQPEGGTAMRKVRAAWSFFAVLLYLAFAGPANAAEFDKYGIESVGASLSDLQAGAHAEAVTSFKIKSDSSGSPFAATRDLEVRLPPGL